MAKQHKNTSRTVKHLIQSAAKGNFRSSFQLYQNYSEGKNVEQKDEDLALEYFTEVEMALIEKKLTLSSLQLVDYRRFRSLDIHFNKNMTVIIGDNGAGKTSIADAIARTLSWLNNNLEKPDVVGRPIKDSDIHVESREFSEVTSKFKFDNNNTFETTLGNTVLGYDGSSPTDVVSIKQVANMYKSTAKNPLVNIPLLAFYSVERSDFSLSSTISEKASGDGASNRFSDLKTALDGSGKLEDFSKLYIELVNLAEGEETKEVQALKVQISNLQDTINDVYAGQEPPENDVFNAKLSSKKEELANLLIDKPSAKYQRHLEFVNNAIETLVPDVKNLEVDRSSGKSRLLVENFGNKVNIAQLSQGQKMLVALSGDLARRLVKLNPDSDAPLNGHGVVVIDEIELHLHPKWQQEILIGLQATFPKLQFIVTTHSPQVLSTVDKQCIRQICLDDHGNPTISMPTFQTKGVTSADILARIMGTNSVPEKLEEAGWLSDFSRCLKDQDKKSLENVFSKIKEHFGTVHPVVADCESQIRIAKMKSRLNREQ
ncbi:AAA family ATPase [Vibrio sp. G41H]|uniref:retron Ec78 anti-phage system effector ATPase PtuA n=1 Tax=unclassified Vibrio TaxID=2614977 RepID=UPI001AD786C6|nr:MULTISPECIES: retron Ec78 anti-phage system effector ATPase PtuA [unclassified Vibrio]MBO7910488.1 AAA family ATPase [Vibrio sp. G41H]MCF7489320.1 AAA family ATPase [Vibrio sp. G-C-1]